MPAGWAIAAFGAAPKANVARHAALKKDFILPAFYQEETPPSIIYLKLYDHAR
jgi:hypothetical protein